LSQGEQKIPVSIHLSTLGNEISKGFVVMAFQDISERLRNEEAKQETQKMAVIGNLVGGIAHELNNILASITGNLFLAKIKLVGHEDVAKRLDIAERLSFDMGDIIAHLMAFSGQSVLSRENISFKTLVEKSIAEYTDNLSANIMFEHDICLENLELFAAEEQLQQILSHLLKNAADAVVNSNVARIHTCLTLYEADAEFSLQHQVEQHTQFAKLRIQDNGCGISEQALPHIFDPFFTEKDFGAGKGLGLSMVQGAVQMHNGMIEVQSEVGRGSQFDIYLPLENQEERLVLNSAADKLESNAAILATQLSGKSILLVEDDEDVQATTKAILQSLEFSVMTANDGEEGVEMYRQHQQEIGLVLMDIMMPRMNGTLACKKIREINAHVKVVFVSGFDQNSARFQEMGLANELFLRKPYNVMALHEMIAREMEGS
ncbi:MAG: response regulator, partial [Mariprofundaceae bacterium]|nr:response regulator [Mariprofundaceae bacterium]